MADYLWDKNFSQIFVKNYWEQHPGVFDYPSQNSFTSLNELFYAVSHMPQRGPSDRLWLQKKDTDGLFRMEQQHGLDLLGPQAKDKDFDTFFERMQQHQFGINIHHLGLANADIDKRMHSIVTELPLPNVPKIGGWISDTFFGNYKATPFGIHRDPASVFAICLKGERTYYTWPETYFHPDHPDLYQANSVTIAKHIKNAEVFNVKTGQLFYWPSNRWHIATSHGKPTVVAQISAYFNPMDVGH